MASPKVASIPTKMSFAKIAAMPAPQSTAPNTSNNIPETKARLPEKTSNSQISTSSGRVLESNNTILPLSQPVLTHVDSVTGSIEGLSLLSNPTKSSQRPGGESSESAEDDQSHLSSSSLKQQSFETKSMASVTTFAMDEKESIRPDDSASVRAVEDDERSTLSRSSTFQHVEASAVTARSAYRGMTITARRFPTITLANPPRFGDLPVDSVSIQEDVLPSVVDQGSDGCDLRQSSRQVNLSVTPDEKLLEALATPKDRLPLLQLEERILDFIQSKTDVLELPPQNSFARLLSHKLADYYSLAHHANEDNSSVRMFRTTCCSLPTSLATLAASIPLGNTHNAGITAIKIMRRAMLDPRLASANGSTAASSSVPSKAASEIGAETNSDEGLMSPVEGTPSKDKSKLSREEREAQYKAARERIFGDFQESIPSEGASTGEQSASMSRSSSSSGRRKSRKHKGPKDDSFEARSAFIPSYTSLSAMQPQHQNPYTEQLYHTGYPLSSTNFMPNMDYGSTPTQSFPGFDVNAGYAGSMGYEAQPFASGRGWAGMQAAHPSNYVNYSQASHEYQAQVPSMVSHTNGQYTQQSSNPMQQQHHSWMNNQFQNSYPSTPTLSNQGLMAWPNFATNQNVSTNVAYPYGQQPLQNYSNPALPAQHLASENQSRSLFNPQTRSFVPNSAPTRSAGKGNRKKTPSNRSSNSVPKHDSESPVGSLVILRGAGGSTPSSRYKEESLKEKYGTPANLPNKPPPSQVLGTFDTTETQNHGPLVVNGSSA